MGVFATSRRLRRLQRAASGRPRELISKTSGDSVLRGLVVRSLSRRPAVLNSLAVPACSPAGLRHTRLRLVQRPAAPAPRRSSPRDLGRRAPFGRPPLYRDSLSYWNGILAPTESRGSGAPVPLLFVARGEESFRLCHDNEIRDGVTQIRIKVKPQQHSFFAAVLRRTSHRATATVKSTSTAVTPRRSRSLGRLWNKRGHRGTQSTTAPSDLTSVRAV